MISFRYHIVSIVSVFLALAIGVALGGGPLKGEVDNTLVSQVQTDRATKRALQTQIVGLRSSNTFTDDFATTVAPGLVGNTLRGRAVTLVVLPTAQQSDVSALSRLVGVAGGTVGGTVRVGLYVEAVTMDPNVSGSKIDRIVWPHVRPNAYAASDCPRGSALTPARTISAITALL